MAIVATNPWNIRRQITSREVLNELTAVSETLFNFISAYLLFDDINIYVGNYITLAFARVLARLDIFDSPPYR